MTAARSSCSVFCLAPARARTSDLVDKTDGSAVSPQLADFLICFLRLTDVQKPGKTLLLTEMAEMRQHFFIFYDFFVPRPVGTFAKTSKRRRSESGAGTRRTSTGSRNRLSVFSR